MTSSGGYHARKSNAADGKKTSKLSQEFTGHDTSNIRYIGLP